MMEGRGGGLSLGNGGDGEPNRELGSVEPVVEAMRTGGCGNGEGLDVIGPRQRGIPDDWSFPPPIYY